eukprot:GGOE01034860.1.p1 GENE.GGOE01034860.1~~GGOE01034860.1.p1  ORF type:complete len:1009 (-),score=291.19 GGOE01034860.1:1296-3932(-)
MDSVVTDFKGVATGYSSQLRAALAAKASTALLQTINTRNASMQRIQMLSAIGLLNLTREPWEPIDVDDCMLLGVLCASATDMSTAEPVTLVLATGRAYSCVAGKNASISQILLNGTNYTEQVLSWVPDANSALVTKQRCLAADPAVQVVGQGCPLPQGCGCGDDQRCNVWYTDHAADKSPNFANGEAFLSTSGALTSSISYSLFNTGGSPSLIAVVSNNIKFTAIDYYLASLVTTVNGTILAMMHNDTYLTMVGNTGAKCTANETVPGNASLPIWSGQRSCDSGVRSVAEWLLRNRATPWSSATLNISGVVWDIYPTNLGVMSYYCIIGTPLSVINAAVDASDGRASTQLNAVRTEQLSRVAISGAATKAYMMEVGKQNALASEEMEETFLLQIEALQNTSMAALTSSQQLSTAQMQQLTDSQTIAIKALTSKHLDAMAVATGWTIAVVFAILLVVLLGSAWRTVQITHDLSNIIDLMEDVANMRVENLVVPQKLHVTEVARIGTAFQVLVQRLAEYKSYIPAGVFEQMQQHDEKGNAQEASDSEGDRSSSADSGSQRMTAAPSGDKRKPPRLPPADAPGVVQVHHVSSDGSRSSASTTSSKNSVRHRAAVLSFHVFDFTQVLLQMAPALAKKLLSQCITNVHEAASQGRGNIDFVAGDQIFVTFNAHIPCADPSGAAVTAALEIRRLLWNIARDRLKFQIGISFGPVLAGSVGYSKFRSMATLGGSMKVASMVSQMSGFENGAILVDASMEERMKYVYDLQPVALVHFPQLKNFPGITLGRRVFLVQANRQLQEDEWLYQVEKMSQMSPHSVWQLVFDRVAAAMTVEEGRRHLESFLRDKPQDAVALWLRDRFAVWTPGCGLPLWDRADHDLRNLPA